MAIYHSFDDEKEKTGGACQVVPQRECFYCYKELGYPVIMWGGNGTEIWLHPNCLNRLVIRLYRDLWESQTIHKHVVSKK